MLESHRNMPRFDSIIYKIGINPVIDPPERVMKLLFDQAGRSRGPIPVRGKINGAEFLQTVVKYQGAWRLYVNGPMLKSCGSKVGDSVKIEIDFDPDPRDVPMSGQLADAFRRDKVAKAAFEKLSPSRQKEIQKYLGSLKTEESIRRNVERILHHLRGEDTDGQYAMMRRKKA